MSNFLALQRQMAASGQTVDQIIAGVNPTVWLAARKETVYSDNDPVGVADDWTGNLYRATQSVAARKPLFKTGVLNGLPTFRFDGSNDGLLTPTLPGTIHDGSFTIICVWRNSITGARILYDTTPHALNSNGGVVLFTGYTTTALVKRTTTGSYMSSYDIAGLWATDNVWRVSAHCCNNTHSSHLFYENGHAPSSWATVNNADPGSTLNSQQISIGCKNAGGSPSNCILGDIAEWIAFPESLSTADRQAIEDALGSTYGITITH